MTNPSDPRLLTQVKQYRFVRELGRGGMGTVHEAVDSRDGGRVAVKLLHPWLAAEDSSFRDRFEREAHIAALLRSPYSVRLLDFGVADGTYFLVMEFVEGTTVGSELERGPLEPLRALRIAIDVARALEEAAARGVVHRDIKPDNILLTDDGRVKVTDFGIARQEGGTGLTSAGRFVGTAEFAAPEQAVGEADHRADIYSLGATLYCMLSGHPPFQGTSVWEILRAHQSSPLSMEPLTHLPDSVCNPIRRCLEKDPRDRYQSASELAGALERALAAFLHATEAPRGGAGRIAGPPVQPPATAQSQPAAAPSVPPQAAPATRVGMVAPQPAAQQTQVAPPSAAAQVPTAPMPGGGAVTMVAIPAGEAPGGVSTYQLAVTNGTGAPVRLALSAADPTGTLGVNVAQGVSLGPGETQQLPVQVRQLRPAPGGARTLQFQLVAQREDGSRAAFVNVTVIPSRAAAKGGGSRTLLLVAIALLLVGGGAAAFMLLGGGDSKPKQANPGTSTPAATATASAPATTTTPEPSAAGSSATTSASPSAAVPASVQALDRWDYNFKITATDCSFGARVGDRYPVAFRFKPVSGDQATLKDGDRVNVTGIQDREIPLGTFTFHVANFEFTYPVAATGNQRGTATLRTTFANATSIAQASLTERYDSPSCTITAVTGP